MEMLREHNVLFENPVTKMGEIHRKLLEAEILVEEKRHNDKELGEDEIHWWIFLKERNIVELKAKTQQVLQSAQKLKEEATTLRKSLIPKEYSDIINGLKKFCITYEPEIQNYLDYVDWLASKDPMAVIIIYNYRVWGSTRRGDRRIVPDSERKEATMKRCVEIALGLRQYMQVPAIVRQYYDVDYDQFQDMDPEDYNKRTEFPWDLVISRSANEILVDVEDYFKGLRDACRDILSEIREYEDSVHILHDDNFWKSFVRHVMDIPVENMLWDFKETLPIWQKDNVSKKKKRRNVCEFIASFANMKGGVLIIGISDQMPRQIVGLEDVENKVKHIKDVIRTDLDYENDLTHFKILHFEKEDKICLLIIIKSAMRPVGVFMKKFLKSGDALNSLITSYYPIRNETGTVNITHTKFRNDKPGMKHDSFDFVTTLYTNYSGKK